MIAPHRRAVHRPHKSRSRRSLHDMIALVDADLDLGQRAGAQAGQRNAHKERAKTTA